MIKKILIKIVQEIKLKLEILNNYGVSPDKVSIKINPIENFKDKENYPLDFQIYMELIGCLSIGKYFGWLDLIEPIKLTDYYKSDQVDLIPVDSMLPEDYNDETKILGSKVKFIRLIANDCDGYFWYFDTGSIPYKFCTSYGDVGIFLSYLHHSIDFFESEFCKGQKIMQLEKTIRYLILLQIFMFVISRFFHFLTDIMPWYEPEEDIPDMIIYSYCILFVVYTVNLFFYTN